MQILSLLIVTMAVVEACVLPQEELYLGTRTHDGTAVCADISCHILRVMQAIQ